MSKNTRSGVIAEPSQQLREGRHDRHRGYFGLRLLPRPFPKPYEARDGGPTVDRTHLLLIVPDSSVTGSRHDRVRGSPTCDWATSWWHECALPDVGILTEVEVSSGTVEGAGTPVAGTGRPSTGPQRRMGSRAHVDAVSRTPSQRPEYEGDNSSRRRGNLSPPEACVAPQSPRMVQAG